MPIEKQVDNWQLAEVAPAPRVEVLIELLRDAADRALAQAAPAERVGEERADVLSGQPAHIHPPYQTLQIRRAGLEPLGHPRLKWPSVPRNCGIASSSSPASAGVSAHSRSASRHAAAPRADNARGRETPWPRLRSPLAACSARVDRRSRPSAAPEIRPSHRRRVARSRFLLSTERSVVLSSWR
jgi:hypothetical protein